MVKIRLLRILIIFNINLRLLGAISTDDNLVNEISISISSRSDLESTEVWVHDQISSRNWERWIWNDFVEKSWHYNLY